MGAKTWMLVASEAGTDPAAVLRGKPALDEDATRRLVADLFPGESLVRGGDGDLTYTCPPDDHIVAGCFPGVAIVAAKDFAIDNPSLIDPRFLRHFVHRDIVVHAMHSVVDWFAFAVWKDALLTRALSLSPDSGVIEDIGPKLAFEEPFWDGRHPAVDPDEEDDAYPFVFHPLELGEAALENFFGYRIEGFAVPSHPDPESVRLLTFVRRPPARPWWKFW